MQEFMRNFTQLNGVKSRVKLEHYLFDNQTFNCDDLQTINDDARIGLILKGQEKFVYKQDVCIAEINGHTYKISDGSLSIIVNKL